MDKRSRNFQARWVAWVQATVQLYLCIAPLAAQEGFISIDCGCNSTYVDSVTGITWVSDEGYISTGVNSKQLNSKKSTPNNATQLWDLRHFPENRMRECYILPVNATATYLVRSMFLYSYFGAVYDTLSFDLTVNATFWTTVTFGGSGAPNLNMAQTYEMVFRSEGTLVSICLVRHQGSPFISSLELRKLDESMYSTVVQKGGVLMNQARFNFGANPGRDGLFDNTRYPDDQYDRIWTNYGSIQNSDCPADLRNSTPLIPLEARDRPPVKVMEYACISYNSSIILSYSFPITVQDYYATLFLQEIDGNVSGHNPRGENIRVTDTHVPVSSEASVNVTSTVHQLSAPVTNLSDYQFTVTISKANWSTLAPIVNAAEFYLKSTINTSDTDNSDVTALDELRASLDLMSWTGDPCFPISWDWLTCDYSIMPSRVTGLNLTGTGITGFISPAITGLTQLTDLWLDNNYLTGSIPDLSALTKLQTVLLQNNNLTGAFPSSLFQLPQLSMLDVESNNLSGSVPACPKQSILTFRCDENPQLQCPSGLQKCSTAKSSSRKTVYIIVGVILGALVLFTFIILRLGCWYWRRQQRAKSNRSKPPVLQKKSNFLNLSGDQKDRAPSFTLEETIQATNNFAKKIGEGSFGAVYYGKLPSGQEIAVKLNSGKTRQGTQEFVNEVNLLSRVHHKNLVSLLGYCEESGEQILVYAYMSKGTLRQHLYGEGSQVNKPLDWITRLNIAISSAKGLEYLHVDCNPGIIHRDVKSSNILLDDKLVAKVADFGLSKSGIEEGFTSGFSTAVKGTFGYFDPEYFLSQKLTKKSDVYSFGVVLLEIISGRPPHHTELPDGSLRTLIEFMHRALKSNIFAMVDPKLEGKYNPGSMRRVIELAATCVEDRGINRPDMRRVVQGLLSAWDEEVPHSHTNSGSISSPSHGDYPPQFSASSSTTLSSAPTSYTYMSSDPSYTIGR